MCRLSLVHTAIRLRVGLFVLGLCAVLPIVPQAMAADKTWTGADPTSPTNFEVGNNWTDGTPADNLLDDKAVFNVKGTLPNPALTRDRNIHGLQFNSSGWTLGGADYTVTVGAGGINTTLAGAGATIQAKTALGTSSTWTMGSGWTGHLLTLSGGLSSNAGQTLTLSAATWYNQTLYASGSTSLAGDVVLQVSNLRIANYTENSITGNLRFHGGVLSINADFARDLGNGPGQMQFTGGSPNGFTNYGSSRITIALGDGNGGAADLKWNDGWFKPNVLVLAGSGAGTGGITLPNAIDLNGTNRMFYNYGSSNYTAELAGVFSNSGTGVAGILKHINSTGITYLANNANTFNGPITIQGGTLQFDTIGNVGSGPSALGNPTTESNARIALGGFEYNLVWTGALLYTGSNTLTTNRPIQLGGHAAIRSSGTGAISFTANMQPAINDTARTFTLGGANMGDNTFAGTIVDRSVNYPTLVVKADAGTWILSGANTYTGSTAIKAGTLRVDGTIHAASAVTVSAGATLGGSGSIDGLVDGAGLVSPGASAGILSVATINPSTGMDFAFEFGQTGSPDYDNAADSINDLLRLTGDDPVTAVLNVSNKVDVYFGLADLKLGDQFRGGVYVDKAIDAVDRDMFLGMVQGANYNYYVLGDGSGTHSFGEFDYYTLAEYDSFLQMELSVVAEAADFGSGAIPGSVLQLRIVPEPALPMLILFALPALLPRRRRNTATTRSTVG